MKFGLRTPSIKRSLKARTTGRAKKAVKKALIPGYGKKGMGWVKSPKKAAYNKVYNIIIKLHLVYGIYLSNTSQQITFLLTLLRLATFPS